MKVFITGGTGRVGQAATSLLIEQGHQVTVVGRRDDMPIDRGIYRKCDVNDYDTLVGAVKGHDAIVHLAAIPDPVGHPGRDVFRVNALGTFSVFEAAAACGINRVVSASSINAFGYYFGDRSFSLEYLPIDEDHPGLATDAYSHSKQVMESIGSYFWERDRISGVMLRLPGVHNQERYEKTMDRFRNGPPKIVREILALPEDERVERIRRISDGYDQYRSSNRLDKVTRMLLMTGRTRMRKLLTRDEFFFASFRANFFTWIHELDSAQAISRSITAEYEGSHPLYVNVNRNALGLPLEQAVQLYGTPGPTLKPTRGADDSLVSIDRARDLIGFEPEYFPDPQG